MKKTIAVAVALLFLLGFASFTFAQDKTYTFIKEGGGHIQRITGTVVSIDKANEQIVVKDNKTQENMTFRVNKHAINTVKVGDEVIVTGRASSTYKYNVMVVKSHQRTE